jgi:hypothetical protein
MKRPWLLVVVGLTLGVCVGCGQAEQAPRPEQIAAEKVQQALDAGEIDAGEDVDRVTVAQGGSVFDPPVLISQIPPGTWYCDMGTVHYAQPARGDGVCRECGMPLTKKGGEAAAP